MLRAIGRALRRLISEALEGSTNWGAHGPHIVGRLIYSWFRGDREISDAYALLVVAVTLVLGLIVLGLLVAAVLGVMAWLKDSSTPARDSEDPPDAGERPWWE